MVRRMGYQANKTVASIQYHECKIQWQIQYTSTKCTKIFLIYFILCGNSSSGPLTACNFDFSWKEGSSIRETGGKRKKKIEKIILFIHLLLFLAFQMWLDLILCRLILTIFYSYDWQTGNFFACHSPNVSACQFFSFVALKPALLSLSCALEVTSRDGRSNSTGQIGAGGAGQGKDSVLQDGAGHPSLLAILRCIFCLWSFCQFCYSFIVKIYLSNFQLVILCANIAIISLSWEDLRFGGWPLLRLQGKWPRWNVP